MLKTDKQLLLEAQRGKDLKEILIESLQAHRGKKNMILAVALDVGVSHATIYDWCRDLGIDLNEFK